DVLAGGPAPPVQVDAVLKNGRGFQLSTGVEVGEAVFILNGEGLLWRPHVKIDKKNIMTIDLEAFGILDVCAVKPDMLILGTGLRNEFVSSTVRDHLHSMGIQVDTMDTRNAASTFNVLAAEGRSIACALLP
ncbi:NADH dehydrogenase 1 alpha subcomplex assembly factor 3, partial [Protomyces lactucae-debilis]